MFSGEVQGAKDRNIKPAQESEMEETTEREWLFVEIDEYGNLVDSSYLPMLGSRIDPSIPLESSGGPARAKFQLDKHGFIVNGSPPSLNGRRVVLHSKSSPALGRTGPDAPACAWRLDEEGNWVCS